MVDQRIQSNLGDREGTIIQGSRDKEVAQSQTAGTVARTKRSSESISDEAATTEAARVEK